VVNENTINDLIPKEILTFIPFIYPRFVGSAGFQSLNHNNRRTDMKPSLAFQLSSPASFRVWDLKETKELLVLMPEAGPKG